MVHAFTQRSLAPEFSSLLFWRKLCCVTLISLWSMLFLKEAFLAPEFLSFVFGKNFLVSLPVMIFTPSMFHSVGDSLVSLRFLFYSKEPSLLLSF